MSILDRIRANGGEAIRSQWGVKLRPGRLTPDAIAWVCDHKRELMREIWPEFDAFEERAAIREFDAGLSRAEAEAAAYAEVMPC